MFDVECVVIGAGVVGLATAYALSKQGVEVMVLEQHDNIGVESSSRNSEVIHAGIYYPQDSLKAQLCVQGKKLLYQFCQQHHIPHQAIGKLIIAQNDAELEQLKQLKHNAHACGVDDLQLLSAAAAQEIEPQIRCAAALYSPSTGIIDSHSLMLSLQGLSEQQGAQIVFHTPVSALRLHAEKGFEVHIKEQDFSLHCRYLINAAGLWAPKLSTTLGIVDEAAPIIDEYCKGQYFSYQGKNPFNHLIYPLPNEAGLGIHSSQDLGGQLRFGPDVQWVPHLDYDPDPNRLDDFYATIRNYWPAVQKDRLQPDFCGIRAKISPRGQPAADFYIATAAAHGYSGLIQLFGIESPGLTACLAIGEYVHKQLLNDTQI